MNATQPLPMGQKILLQRLIAKHCVSSDEAKKMFHAVVNDDYVSEEEDDDDDEDGEGGGGGGRFMGVGIDTPEDAYVSINRQLKPGFGLEIVSLVDKADNNNRYVAVVNTMVDDIAKKESVFSKSWNAHERAFVRLVMRALIDKIQNEPEDDNDNDDEEDDDDNENNPKKSRSSSTSATIGIRRADLINLRSDLENGFKLTLDQATRVVGILMEEKWLRASFSEQKQNRRGSVQAKLELAPRSFLELSHYMTSLGLDDDKLPQFLFHRD